MSGARSHLTLVSIHDRSGPRLQRQDHRTISTAACSTCHTPRNLTFGVDRGRAFAGGDVGAWQAYNISSDPVSGIGLWNDDELLSYLATGKAPGKGYAAGPMAEAVEKSLQHLSDADLSAILLYLRSLRPRIKSCEWQSREFHSCSAECHV
jgi:mono/diheme cytochrome c family protein